MNNYYIKNVIEVCDECNKKSKILWQGRYNWILCQECFIKVEGINFIKEMAYNRSVDYKPFYDNLDCKEYFKEGFEQGFKEALKYFLRD